MSTSKYFKNSTHCNNKRLSKLIISVSHSLSHSSILLTNAYNYSIMLNMKQEIYIWKTAFTEIPFSFVSSRFYRRYKNLDLGHGGGVSKMGEEFASIISFEEHKSLLIVTTFSFWSFLGVKALMIVMFLRVFSTGGLGESSSTNQKFDHSSSSPGKIHFHVYNPIKTSFLVVVIATIFVLFFILLVHTGILNFDFNWCLLFTESCF